MTRIRYAAVVASGVLAALGGAFLSLGFVHSFTQNMTLGTGYIALAAVIFGKWRPGGALARRCCSASRRALAQRLPVFSASAATLFEALPYVLTLIAVAGLVGRSRPPAADGLPVRAVTMAAPRLRAAAMPHAASLRQAAGLVSDEVELYHRTYTTLLRSSGETLLRVLEAAHRAMNSSLHPLAASNELDLGAFLYATQRLPASLWRTELVVMGQEAESFERHGIGPLDELGAGRGARAPAALVRRPREHARGAARLRVGPRRPDPDARRLPDRVEQAPRAPARRALAARGRAARRRGVRRDARRHARRLGAAAAGVGRRGPRAGAERPPRDGSTCACGCSAAATSPTRASPASGGRRCAGGSPSRASRRARRTSSPPTPTRS